MNDAISGGRIVRRLPSELIPNISDAVEVTGNLVFFSGQVGIGSDGSVSSDFEAECDAAFGALAGAMTRAGCEVKDLVRVTIYVTELPTRSLETIRAVRDRWIGTQSASTLVGVDALFRAGVNFEVDAIAVAASTRGLR